MSVSRQRMREFVHHDAMQWSLHRQYTIQTATDPVPSLAGLHVKALPVKTKHNKKKTAYILSHFSTVPLSL